MAIDFLRLYEESFRFLSSGNIQTLMEACCEITGVPILCADVTYNLLGAAPQEKTGDYYWDYLLENRQYSTELVIELYEDSVMQTAIERESPYVLDWGTEGKKHPKILGIIKVDDDLKGYTAMLCDTQEQITPDRVKAMRIIQDVLTVFFKGSATESSGYFNNSKELFMGELLNGHILTQKQLDPWLQSIGQEVKPPYRVIAISAKDASEQNVLFYIQKTLQQLFLFQFTLIQNNVLYFLECGLHLQKDRRYLEKQIKNLQKFNGYCGISNIYHDLLETGDFRTQADDALLLGKKLQPKAQLYHYNDYYLPAILIPRIEDMPQNNYLSPIITQLASYDRKHATDFLSTLRAYVKNLGDTAKVTQELHIHRNTLLYRINKIEEVTSSSIRDYQTFVHLALSFYMMQLQ